MMSWNREERRGRTEEEGGGRRGERRGTGCVQHTPAYSSAIFLSVALLYGACSVVKCTRCITERKPEMFPCRQHANPSAPDSDESSAFPHFHHKQIYPRSFFPHPCRSISPSFSSYFSPVLPFVPYFHLSACTHVPLLSYPTLSPSQDHAKVERHNCVQVHPVLLPGRHQEWVAPCWGPPHRGTAA